MSGASQICSGNSPTPVANAFHGSQVDIDISARGQFIGSALQGQQRPGLADSPDLERGAIGALAVAVMVVTPPARPGGGIDFQHCIDYLQRIFDQRIAGLANAEAHQFQEAGINDLVGGIDRALARLLVRQQQFALIRIFVADRAFAAHRGIDADVMAA